MKKDASIFYPSLENIKKAAQTIQQVSSVTPLNLSLRLSKQYAAQVYLKREDLQQVRSYKIRGAYNKISSLNTDLSNKGVVCASAGNHAQGVALSCKLLKIKGTIYMPVPTPKQKVEQVKMFGEQYVTIKLAGDTFDDAYQAAIQECNALNKTFIHPFNDQKVIEGQATVGLEILNQTQVNLDYVFIPVGGGGLAAGLSSVFKTVSPNTKIIGVGQVCQTILDLYNRDAIVVEPAGALSITALEVYKDKIKNKNVVCVVSGSNNDITRTAEIKERALLFANLKHYFIVKFPQRAGALKEFVVDILGPNDDITHFEYTKKNNRENGSAVVGVELKSALDLPPLIARMKAQNFYGDYLNDKPDLFQFLV